MHVSKDVIRHLVIIKYCCSRPHIITSKRIKECLNTPSKIFDFCCPCTSTIARTNMEGNNL